MSSRPGKLQNTILVALGLGGIVVAADLGIRVALPSERTSERALERVVTAGEVRLAAADPYERTNLRVALPSPYGK